MDACVIEAVAGAFRQENIPITFSPPFLFEIDDAKREWRGQVRELFDADTSSCPLPCRFANVSQFEGVSAR
eukprot:2529428-Lingulodinium_polyedra.AAC.1